MERQQERLQRAFGRVVAKRRTDAGLTQQQMWERIGLSKSPYRRREQTGIDWKLEEQLRVADVLGAKLSELLAEAEELADSEPFMTDHKDPGGDSWMSALGGE